MDEFRVDFVELDSGNIPYEKFLKSLPLRESAEIYAMIEELRLKLSKGEIPPKKVSKHIREGIFELRVSHYNKISRSFYFFRIDKLIVFTHGFIKKTQTIPVKEIKKAIRYKKIYLERNTRNENKI